MRSSGSNPITLTADTDGECVAMRLPPSTTDSIEWGTKLRVNKRQQVLLGPSNGQTQLDFPLIIFSYGRYCLNTASMSQLEWYATQTAARQGPINASLTFVTTDPIADLKWRDKFPLYIADAVLGQIPIHVEASFVVVIEDICLFSQNVMADQRQYSCQNMRRFCQDQLLRPALIKAVKQLNRPIHLLDAYQDELTTSVLFNVSVSALAMGIEIKELRIERLRIPTSVLKSSTSVGQDRSTARESSKQGLYGIPASLGLELVIPRNVARLLPATPGELPDGASIKQAISDPVLYLERLAHLRDRGLLSQSDFDEHKYDLLRIK